MHRAFDVLIVMFLGAMSIAMAYCFSRTDKSSESENSKTNHFMGGYALFFLIIMVVLMRWGE